MLKNIFKSNKDKAKVETLISMGFHESQAKHALDAFDGNLERATNYLLSEADGGINQQQQHAQQQEQQQLERAMAESLEIQHRRVAPSAASVKAGQAAAARAANANKKFGANGKILIKTEKTTSNSSLHDSTYKSKESSYKSTNNPINNKKSILLENHPHVKVPTQMKDKSKEEQILRCAKRLAPYPHAVDTLLRAFIYIRQYPDNDKYRKIDRSSAGYQNVLDGKPGAMDLIHAMNFVNRPQSNDFVMDRSRVDAALLYLGISALEEVQKSSEYKTAKLSIAFEKEIKIILSGQHSATSENDEILKRAEFISKLPSEPSGGAGALMQISLGDEKIMRRFDGDDILRDVIHFIGGHGSVIPEKIISRDWCLVDLNRYPVVPIDIEVCMNKTLQYIGCWPSGNLALQPSTNEWKEDKQIPVKVGSSRGLGAGPSV